MFLHRNLLTTQLSLSEFWLLLSCKPGDFAFDVGSNWQWHFHRLLETRTGFTLRSSSTSGIPSSSEGVYVLNIIFQKGLVTQPISTEGKFKLSFSTRSTSFSKNSCKRTTSLTSHDVTPFSSFYFW